MKHSFFALLIAFSLTPFAHAALVIVTPASPIAIPTTFDGVYLDFDGDLNSVDTYTSAPASFDVNFFFSGLGIMNEDSMQFVRTGLGGPVANLGSFPTVDGSSIIDPGLSVSGGPIGDPFAHVGNGPTQFAVGDVGYLGFAYDPSSSGTPIYGYMEVIFQNGGLPGSILGWRYESVAGVGITPVPESSTWLAMISALGLGPFLFSRRKAKLMDK